MKGKMIANYWIWLVFSCFVILSVIDRILRGNAGKVFPRLRFFVGRVCSFIGWLWFLVFLFSVIVAFRIGFSKS